MPRKLSRAALWLSLLALLLQMAGMQIGSRHLLVEQSLNPVEICTSIGTAWLTADPAGDAAPLAEHAPHPHCPFCSAGHSPLPSQAPAGTLPLPLTETGALPLAWNALLPTPPKLPHAPLRGPPLFHLV